MRALSAFRRWGEYFRLFQTRKDLYRYAQLRIQYYRHGASTVPVPLRVRALGGRSMLCRASQDVWTLRDTFARQYHLPPIELPPRATIVDLGSNVGYTVAHFAHLYPTAFIIGVEIDKTNFDLAWRNTASFGPRVTIIHGAVWISEGMVAYAGEADDAFAVAMRPEAKPVGSAPGMPLESLFERQGLDEVDYLKMDIEGAEAAVLNGPIPWAERVRSMKIEVHPPMTRERCAKVLAANGFTCQFDPRHPDAVVAVKAGVPASTTPQASRG